jgi:hypothetical protein
LFQASTNPKAPFLRKENPLKSSLHQEFAIFGHQEFAVRQWCPTTTPNPPSHSGFATGAGFFVDTFWQAGGYFVDNLQNNGLYNGFFSSSLTNKLAEWVISQVLSSNPGWCKKGKTYFRCKVWLS